MKEMDFFRLLNWPMDFTNVFEGVVVVLNLARKSSLQTYRKQLCEIQKHFNDDIKLIMITALLPGKQRKVTEKDLQEFIKEHGNPPMYHCRTRDDNSIKDGIDHML